MTFENLVERISNERRQELSERLLDALLEAEDAENVPSSLAKTFLNDAHHDRLASEAGLTNLLKAVEEADPNKVAVILGEFGIE